MNTNPKPIMNIYSQRGRWFLFKYLIIMCILFLRKIKYYIFGKRYFHNEKDLDKRQKLSQHDQGFDAVYFNASSNDGIYLSAGIERRHKGTILGFCYVVHPEYGILENYEQPKTILEEDLQMCSSYSGGGIRFTPVTPMKKWKISYNGLMKFHNEPTKCIDVKLNIDWTSNYDWYFFEVDVPIKVLARAIATEPWSIQLFKNLKDTHQSHYEQMGYVNGTLEIREKRIPLTSLDSNRDHSFGFKRDWSLLHRYILCMIHLSNKTKIILLVVSQPCTTSHLEMGFINYANGQWDSIEETDLKLYNNGENGILPKEMKFSFTTCRDIYNVKMQFVHEAQHFKGIKEEAIINYRYHICEVNNVMGRGLAEWHYNILSNVER